VKTRFENFGAALAAIISLSLMFDGALIAQTFSNLYNFVPGSGAANPIAGMAMSGNCLYGATENGYEADNAGGSAVFHINTDGTGFDASVIGYGDYPTFEGGVIMFSNILYGTAAFGGLGQGFIFAVNTDGTGFTNLHSFSAFNQSTDNNSDGAYPFGGLILVGNILYGTANAGGTDAYGTVFAINTDGSGFTNLHSFIGSDGASPYGALVSSGNILYGTAEYGGSNGIGTIFAINTDGSSFSNLYSFSATPFHQYTNSDGAEPQSTLTISGNVLYGTASGGGTGGNGTIFAINTDGSGFANLHSFAPPVFFNPLVSKTNSDGAYPYAGLVLSGNTLYGTTTEGGGNGSGTLFAVNTDGTGFTNLHIFTGGDDGNGPKSVLVRSGIALYGTAEYGGMGYGTVFSLSFAPTLAITVSASNVILTWPTNVAGFDYTGYTLQCTTNLAAPSWSAVSPSPVIVNGQETVTNPISATQMFYRLEQ